MSVGAERSARPDREKKKSLQIPTYTPGLIPSQAGRAYRMSESYYQGNRKQGEKRRALIRLDSVVIFRESYLITEW